MRIGSQDGRTEQGDPGAESVLRGVPMQDEMRSILCRFVSVGMRCDHNRVDGYWDFLSRQVVGVMGASATPAERYCCSSALKAPQLPILSNVNSFPRIHFAKSPTIMLP